MYLDCMESNVYIKSLVFPLFYQSIVGGVFWKEFQRFLKLHLLQDQRELLVELERILTLFIIRQFACLEE